MNLIVEEIGGIGQYNKSDFLSEKGEKIGELFAAPNEKVFLVKRKNTIEVRTDHNLHKLLKERYESVMTSRYFGNGGIEIVMSGQIPLTEIYDIARLSYNLTKEI